MGCEGGKQRPEAAKAKYSCTEESKRTHWNKDIRSIG